MPPKMPPHEQGRLANCVTKITKYNVKHTISTKLRYNPTFRVLSKSKAFAILTSSIGSG